MEITIVAEEIAKFVMPLKEFSKMIFVYHPFKHKLKATHSSFENKDFVEIAARSFKVVVKKSDFTVSFTEIQVKS
ncbi:MAG: hypothetical protein IPK25_14500 [Saprospiraceae bacterium]|nr:hypothetical protein [Saprospiraceae bacterium]